MHKRQSITRNWIIFIYSNDWMNTSITWKQNLQTTPKSEILLKITLPGRNVIIVCSYTTILRKTKNSAGFWAFFSIGFQPPHFKFILRICRLLNLFHSIMISIWLQFDFSINASNSALMIQMIQSLRSSSIIDHWSSAQVGKLCGGGKGRMTTATPTKSQRKRLYRFYCGPMIST